MDKNMAAPGIPAIDSMIEQIQAHVNSQLAIQISEPVLVDGPVKELREFIEQLAARERNKKCGDPGTLVTSSKPSMEGIKYCTVCKKTELEWNNESH